MPCATQSMRGLCRRSGNLGSKPNKHVSSRTPKVQQQCHISAKHSTGHSAYIMASNDSLRSMKVSGNTWLVNLGIG